MQIGPRRPIDRRRDGVASTWELRIDARHIRSRSGPVESFNRIGRLGDRLVEFDTSLHAEHEAGSTRLAPVEQPADLVPLGQVISQHTQGLDGPTWKYVSGAERLREAFDAGRWPTIRSLDRPVVLSGGDPRLADRIGVLAARVERTLVDETRPAIAAHLDAIRRFVERSPAAAPARACGTLDAARRSAPAPDSLPDLRPSLGTLP